jgi:hypothetical protein
MKFLLILFLNTIIVSLALRTRIYSNVIFSIKKIIPDIIMALIIFLPLFGISILINFYGSLYPITDVSNNSDIFEYNYGFREAGIKLLLCSPIILLILCFIVQSDFEKVTKIDANKIYLDYIRMSISMIFNYISIAILVIFILVDIFLTKNHFPIELLLDVKNMKIEEINENSIDFFRTVIMIYLIVIYYIVITFIPNHFIGKIMANENKIIKRWLYKLLIFIPLINIFIIYKVNKKMIVERKNSI